MKHFYLVSFLLVITVSVFAQTDTIFSNNQMILCHVKEVQPDVIKFTYPGEDISNSIYKNIVQKIAFRSGRVQMFSESTSYKTVNKPKDYENVTITQVESEVKGLFKIGDVSSKSKGTTTLSNQERVKERAYRKLKMQAAMQGANVVYLTNQRTEGNKAGGYFQASSSAETNLTGIAYSSQLPDIKKFKALIANKKEFIASTKIKLWGSASDLKVVETSSKFEVFEIINENGLIVLKGKLEGVSKINTFRVSTFSESDFNIFYEGKSSVYNSVIEL